MWCMACAQCSPGAFVGRTSWPSARFRTSSTSGGPWGAPKGHPTKDIPFPLLIPLRIYHGISLVAHRPTREADGRPQQTKPAPIESAH